MGLTRYEEALIEAERKEKQPMKYDWLGRPIKRATRKQADTARRHPVAKNKSRTTKRAKGQHKSKK